MLVIKDFATTILASALTAAATSVVVSDASRLPALSAGDYYYLVLQKFTDRTSVEVVKVTGATGNTLTVVRAQAGTTAKSFDIGDYAEQRVTVGTFSEYIAQSVAGKVDKSDGYVEQSLGLLNTGDLVKATVGISYDATNGHGTILSGGEGANKVTPYVALRPLGVAASSVQLKYAQDGSLVLSGGSRYVETGLLSMRHPQDANGWPNAINANGNNYNNRARGKVHVNNNALYFIADGTFNARRFGIQSGHEDPGYATAYGILDLNPFGGNVRVNGGLVYHTNYVPTPAAVGALALSGGTLTGTLDQNMGGYGVRFIAWQGIAYLQGGKVGGDTADQKLKITGISATALTEFDIITAGHGIARVNGARIYTEQYVPTPSVLGVVPQARTINGKPLTSDITLSAADVGAQPLTRLVRSTNSYLVSASMPQTLLDASGKEVSKTSSYLVRLVTTVTGTITGNIYTLRADNDGNWILRALARSGTGSNHPELSIDASGKPQITTNHPSTYSIVAIMEEFNQGGNHGGRPWFDLESFYSPDNKPTPAALGAVAKTGDTMTGGLTFANAASELGWVFNTDYAKIGFKNTADGDTDSYMWFKTGDNGDEYFKWQGVSGANTTDWMSLKSTGLVVAAGVTAPTFTGALAGNAATATKLATARQINGTNFDGSGNITTANWGTARTITIGNTAKSVDGSGNVSWTLAEIGAPATSSVINGNGNYIVHDTRSVDTPTNLGGLGVKYEFKFNTTDGLNDGGVYHSVMTIQNWGDPSGGNTHQLGFGQNGNLWHRTATIGGTWGAWRQQLNSANFNSFAPTLTGAGASGTWGISVTGNAVTATKLETARTITIGNTGKSFDGSANVSWSLDEIGVTAKDGTGATGTWGISVSGNAATVTKLATARQINGTDFDGTANITTANWGTARALTIGNAAKSVNGGADVAWSLDEIGAVPTSRTVNGKPLSANVVLSAAEIGALPVTGGTVSGVLGVTEGLDLVGISADDMAAIVWKASDGTERGRLWIGGTIGADNSLTWRSGASGATHKIYHEGNKPTAADVGAVPQARTINAKPLTFDIVLSAADVGAVAASDDSYWRYRGGTTNLNDAALARPGYFSFVPGATGIPLAGIYGHGFSIGNGSAAGSGVWYSQIVFGHNNRIYTRNGVNGAAAGAWNYIFTSVDKPTAADVGALPIAGGSLGGSVVVHSSAPKDTVTGLTAAPLMRQHANVGVVSSFIPFGHMSAQAAEGYITHLNFGLYKRGVGTWDGSGMYVATGGSDSSPTEFFLLGYGGNITHSRGHTFYHTGYKPTPTDIGLSVLSQNSNGLRISLNGKYLDIGARNTSWTHFQTDATSGVYFYNNIAAADVQITSDERLKSEFEPIVGALDKVRSLSGLIYTKRAVEGEATKREAGLIAQAVQRVLPEAVGVGADDFLTLSPAGVIALLVEAIKELEAKLNDCTR